MTTRALHLILFEQPAGRKPTGLRLYYAKGGKAEGLFTYVLICLHAFSVGTYTGRHGQGSAATGYHLTNLDPVRLHRPEIICDIESAAHV